MAPNAGRTWEYGERGERRNREKTTIGDLCRAIEEQRIPVTRHDDDYLLTARDLRRWLDGRAPSAMSRWHQRPAS